MAGYNVVFELLTEQEQDKLIMEGLACCGAYCSEAECCLFLHIRNKNDNQKQQLQV